MKRLTQQEYRQLTYFICFNISCVDCCGACHCLDEVSTENVDGSWNVEDWFFRECVKSKKYFQHQVNVNSKHYDKIKRFFQFGVRMM